MTIGDVLDYILLYLFWVLAAFAVGAFGYIVALSMRHKRASSVLQVARLILTALAVVVAGVLSQGIGPDWIAAVFGLVSGLGVSWWYGRHTVRQASLGVNVALILLVASLMALSIATPGWLDPRAFLIGGSLLGIRLLVAASPHARLFVPSRRRSDHAIRRATISMLIAASLAIFVLAILWAPQTIGF